MVLSKDRVLFARDEKGELLPQEVPLLIDEEDTEQVELKDETIRVIPLMRGELKKLLQEIKDIVKSDRDLDGEIIKKYCIEPTFTDKELVQMKGSFSSAIVNTILNESGLDVGKKSKAKAIEAKEDEFAKNSDELSPNDKKET